MNKKYEKLYEILTSLKVLCTLLAVVYIILWFYKFFDFPHQDLVALFFNPAAQLLNIIFKPTVEFSGKTIDMSYIVISVLFYGLYFVFLKAAALTEIAENKYQLSVIEEKKIQEKLVNEDLKEIFKNKTLQYNAFAILLTLNLKYIVEPNSCTIHNGLNELAMKEYVQIVSKMRKKYPTCKAITPNKLFIIYNNFALFDDFFTDILKELKAITIQNTAHKIETSFNIAIDAMKDYDKVAKILDMLEKIATFNYENKAVATSGFNVRYSFNVNRKYKLSTMGISRFFDKKDSNNKKSGSVDFELFLLKNAKKASQ